MSRAAKLATALEREADGLERLARAGSLSAGVLERLQKEAEFTRAIARGWARIAGNSSISPSRVEPPASGG